MESINLNEILNSVLGKKVTKIQTGSELLLAHELNKYAKSELDKEVNILGISIKKELLSEPYFFFVRSNGLVMNEEYNNIDFHEFQEHKFFTGDLRKIVFESKTEDTWVYSHDTTDFANRSLMTGGSDDGKSYISLMALIIIYQYKNSKKIKLVVGTKDYAPMEFEYCELLVLRDYGNKLLSDENLEIQMRFDKNQPEWEAFCVMNRQLGFMNRQYTAEEKYKLFRREFSVGDVMLLYKRETVKRSRSVSQLISCFPAVVREIDDDGIRIDYYPIIETKLTRKANLDKSNSSMYSIDDYNTFTTCSERLNWLSLGVDVFTWIEEKFVLSVLDFDGTTQVLSDGVTSESVFLGTPDTVYAVFKDRGVKFNEAAFKEKHFKNKVPVYDQYLNRYSTK